MSSILENGTNVNLLEDNGNLGILRLPSEVSLLKLVECYQMTSNNHHSLTILLINF